MITPSPPEIQRERPSPAAWFIAITIVVVGAVITVALFANGHRVDLARSKLSFLPDETPTTAHSPCVSTVPRRPPEVLHTYATAPPMTTDPAKHYVATMTTSCGSITIALDPAEAPQAVNSFIFLAQHHFYEGLMFHRVVKDFVVQGGDPMGNGRGGPGYNLPTEAPPDGYSATSVSMANAGPDTTGSQFFFTWTPQAARNLGGPPYLYSTIGHVTTGLDVVATLGSFAPTSGDGTPTRPLYIFKVSISIS